MRQLSDLGPNMRLHRSLGSSSKLQLTESNVTSSHSPLARISHVTPNCKEAETVGEQKGCQGSASLCYSFIPFGQSPEPL